jgi:hypothetical protein
LIPDDIWVELVVKFGAGTQKSPRRVLLAKRGESGTFIGVDVGEDMG